MASFRLLWSVILFLLTSSNSSSSNDDESDGYNCVTPKGKCGNCIALPKCDSLSKILTETPINPKSIRYLQKSTCGFSDDKVPQVCCPKPFSSNSKTSDICSDILPTSDTSDTADSTNTTSTPNAITTTAIIPTSTPTTTTTTTSTTTTTPPTTESTTTTPSTTTAYTTISSTTTTITTTPSPATSTTTTSPTTNPTPSTSPTTTTTTTIPTTTPTTTTTMTPSPITTESTTTPTSTTTEKKNIDTSFNSSLITTEKPPEHLEGSSNQTASSSESQNLVEKIILHPNLHLLPNSSDCGKSSFSDRIIGGHDAGLGKYPWVVLLGFSDDYGQVQYACGGTLISNRYVLTASHCVSHLPAGFKLATVRVGEYDQRTDPDCFNKICAPNVQNIDVEKIIHHEDYDKTNHKENDIALLRLAKEAELSSFVLPVCLSHGEEILKPKKIDFFVAGFGRVTFDSPENANVLQEVAVPLVPMQKCNSFYESKEQVGHIDDSRFCAGGQNGKGHSISLTNSDFSKPELLTSEITYHSPHMTTNDCSDNGENSGSKIFSVWDRFNWTISLWSCGTTSPVHKSTTLYVMDS